MHNVPVKDRVDKGRWNGTPTKLAELMGCGTVSSYREVMSLQITVVLCHKACAILSLVRELRLDEYP